MFSNLKSEFKKNLTTKILLITDSTWNYL